MKCPLGNIWLQLYLKNMEIAGVDGAPKVVADTTDKDLEQYMKRFDLNGKMKITLRNKDENSTL